MLVPLKFKPGVIREPTAYAAEGGWFDCDMVRFHHGSPEKIGGWQKMLDSTFLGTCRALINWTILSGANYFGLGTNLKYYVLNAAYVDVTPIRRTVTLGADPFAATITSTTVTVTDAANGSVVGDFVTFSGATTFAGIPAGDLNQEHQITAILSANTYTITVDTAATSTASGGGGAVDADYQINIGLDDTVLGLGWGASPWGSGGWGSAASAGPSIELRLWSHDTFGEDLIANVRNGGIYYWDATAPNDRMVALEDLAGANEAPTVATQILVSAEERHVIALGTNPIGSAVQDPLFVRWSATESAVEWEPLATNTAGGYRLSVGTRIVAAVETRSEILIWTDTALYSMRWIGGQFVFSFTLLAIGTNIIAPNAFCTINDICIWMGKEQFYMYDGRITPLESPVSDYIFNRMNLQQTQKIYGSTNSTFDEVLWIYPASDECDSYVIFNYKEKAWYYGMMSRTAWLDRGPSYYPVATSTDSYLYDHEFGFDDGSTNPPSAINAYIESCPIESQQGGAGEHFQFVTRLIPDVTFRNSSAASPSVDMTVKMQNYPGANFSQDQASTITQSATVPIEQFTQQAFIRLRGRSAIFRVESDAVGVTWRLGTPRLDIRPDGRR
jgi:hypothetical protein